MIQENLLNVHEKIKKACERSGRNPEEIKLLCVSKLKPMEDLIACYEAGERSFGENYVQELCDKLEDAANHSVLSDASFHMIGHLQRNKVKYIIGKVAMIHSVDSIRLLDEIEKESTKKDVITEVLLEVNIAKEESKWGFTEEELPDLLLDLVSARPHVKIVGLMTSAPYTNDAESNRIHFKNLKNLLDKLRFLLENAGLPEKAMDLKELSMGMTGDYEVAIEEGATMVRVGTGIFGERDYSH